MSTTGFELSTAPYPGLRPFRIEESDIFFGRDDQTDELLERLSKHRFLAVTGPSGCGKSSLVKAGMIPALNAGFMVVAGSRWRVCQMRPGDGPLARLVRCLAHPDVLGPDRSGPEALPFVEAALRRGPLGLVEVVRESAALREMNLLVVVDQFEEIFRYREKSNPDETDAFVALLLATAASPNVGVYVAITMRSDYLGQCAVFHGLPEAINDGQYLTPRLTREECSAAITGPALVFAGEVNPTLVNRLLNDFGPDPDQLPLLQHALMRMWDQAARRTGGGGPVELTLDDYTTIGGLRQALSIHADEALSELGPDQRHVAEIMFRRLTERRQGQGDTRRPALVGEVAAVAGVEESEVTAVVEVFQRPGRSFIAESEGSLLDIGHESLIRQWHTLAQWVDAEAKSAAMYQRLRDTALLWKKGQAALWTDPDLANALRWKEREEPTAPWATRYSDAAEDFPLAMEFLGESEKASRARLAAAERQRGRQLKRAWAVATASLLAVVGLVSYILVHRYFYVWPHTAYYNAFVQMKGAPHGIGNLSPDQVRHRSVSLEIVTRGSRGPVLKMRAVDSRGQPTAHHGIGTYLKYAKEEREQSAPVLWEYAYDDFDQVSHEMAYGKKGELLWTLAYMPTGSDTRSRMGLFLGPTGLPLHRRGYSDHFILIDYSPEGYEARRRYRSRGGKPVRALDEAFGQEFEYDTAGNRIKIFSLGPDDQRINDVEGNCGLVSSVDRLGSAVEETAYDAAGAVTSVRGGWSRRRSAYDEYERQTKEAYFDEAFRPVLNNHGYHRATYRYDESGNIAELRRWDTAGKAAFLKGDGCHGHRTRYDERGDAVEITCVGPDGDPATNSEGYVTLAIEYDQQGNQLNQQMRSLSGQQVSGKYGYSRRTMKYDPKGNLVELSYFGPDGAPVAGEKGFWREDSEYDDHGNVAKVAFLGVDKRPFTKREGYAGLDIKYDEDGNIVDECYLDSDGKRTLNNEGVAGWRVRYDSQGNEIEFVYFGLDERPTVGTDGYAGQRTEYDPAGNISLVTYFGIDGQPVSSKDGIAGWRSEHNAFGKETFRQFLGCDGRPTTHRLGYAAWRAAYDRGGASVTKDYFDVAGNPAEVRPNPADKSPYGYSRTVFAYTPQGWRTEESYFGKYGQAKLVGAGFARAVHTYDSRGNNVESAYFGAHGKKVLIEGGYHRVRRDYDERGNPREVRYFGVEDEPVNGADGYFLLVRRYDRYGRKIESSVFNTDNDPVVTSEGYHRLVEEYDERGHQCGERYFGSAGPVLNTEGYHAVKKVLDPSGNTLAASYHGTAGELMANRETGCAVEENQYDPRGRLSSTLCLGLDRKPVTGREGSARLRMKYNDRGDKIEQAAYGPDENPVMLSAGYSSSKMEYDSQGRLVGSSYFGTNGQPVSLPNGGESSGGYASLRREYDVYGNLTGESFYGPDGKAVLNNWGYHKLQQRYNARQELEEQSTWDTQGKLVFNIAKYARVTRTYDNQGRLVEILAYDAKGRLSAAKYGYARMVLAYDVWGNQISEAYFGADGRPTVLPGTGNAGWSRTYDDRGNVADETSIGADGKPL